LTCVSASAVTLVDSHCHLDFEAFAPDRPAVLERAIQADVLRLVNPGIDLPTSRAVLQLSAAYPQVFASVGIHPNTDLPWEPALLAELEQLAAAPKVVAIGEIGLDYYRRHTPPAAQQQLFRQQLALAGRLGLPVIVHSREAMPDTLSILAEWHSALANPALAARPGVLHAFAGDLADARQAIGLNFYLGIGGPVTFKNARRLQGLVAELPMAHLLLETDAPFLAPHPWRGQRNEPAYVRLVAEKIAELHHLPLAQVAQVTRANAAQVFNWRELA
jgi:TatD DNase family protein